MEKLDIVDSDLIKKFGSFFDEYKIEILIGIILIIVLFYFLKENKIPNVFDNIYINNEWGKDEVEFYSGSGSKPSKNKQYIKFLRKFIKENNIKSIVDIGCGDWQIMKHINLNNINYYGYDVSGLIIDTNNKKYSNNNIKFIKTELDNNTDYKKADLLICKDVLQHLSYKNINKILSQLYKYKYSFIINDTQNEENIDIDDGGYRLLDIRKNPFNLKVNNVYNLWPELREPKVLMIV